MICRRENTKEVKIGNVTVGGVNEVVIQSMCTTKTNNVEATVKQILELEEAGCQIVRVACPMQKDALAIAEIKKQINIPLVADIHFDYRIALTAIEAGADKIRINPGNIGGEDRVLAVVEACRAKNIPIRIGVNAGSLEKHILDKYGYPTAQGMLESAIFHVECLEKVGFTDIIISMKSSDMLMAIEAYKMAAERFNYPLHIGITESGTSFGGTIKSSIGLGVILSQGIGSTMRVSLSEDPVEEIKVCKEILKNFELLQAPMLISCPTCGRIEVDMIPIAHEIEDFLTTIQVPIKVAILGCAVNGPGEAKEADLGIACAVGEGLLFRHGEVIEKVPEDMLLERLKEEIVALNNV